VKLSRRTFSAALVGLTAKADRPIVGGFVNESFQLGHRLRDHAAFPKPTRQIRVPVVIVGAGMAGLSAAWRLDKHGFRDFAVLEMESQPGGNARWGENDITRYPWAAHYVPVPQKGESLVRELFEEFGLYRDGRWDERALCFDPQERLFLHGRWQEGIEPELGATQRDHDQYRRFESLIKDFRASGQFTIPMERGSKPSALDNLPFDAWLRQQGFDSPYVRWYMNYACRDDYGALAKDTSAWAGIHYFAAREPEEKGPLTWPEGNGWITRKLTAKLSRYLHTGEMVYRIIPERSRIRIITTETEYIADSVVFAAPTFLAHYVIEGAPPAVGFQYSPWLTANLTLEHPPAEDGSEVAWDNVLYDSPALGYVDAAHMSVATREDRSVWTYYWSLAEYAPLQARTLLLEHDWNYWKEAILNDLSRAHPDLRSCVSRIDIMRMGHAMIRPAPGFVFSEERKRWLTPMGQIHFANSDLSGFSIFEEAQYRGVQAADRILTRHTR
jgi:glycine/D-amino acid oxidase-like deaminating enzyme